MLYATVEQIVAEREDIIGGTVKSTHVVKTKKRRKAKQHPTPSQTHHHQPVKRTGHLVSPAHRPGDDVDKPLTAEEIAKLYEEDEN